MYVIQNHLYEIKGLIRSHFFPVSVCTLVMNSLYSRNDKVFSFWLNDFFERDAGRLFIYFLFLLQLNAWIHEHEYMIA